MRIISLNAWGGRLHEQLVPYLVEADPDVLCLQEVTRTLSSDADWLIYRDHDVDLPQRAHLFEEVSAALGAHQAYFCPAARGDLFDDERAVASEWGIATFVRKGMPVIGQAQDFVHGGFAADGWGEHPRSRNAHVVRLFDPDTTSTIVVAHLHGLRDLAGKGDTPARRTQAAALSTLVRQLWDGEERLVVCGDFNILPDSMTFDVLRELGLTDLVTTRGYTDTRTSFYAKTPRFADYMLVTAKVDVRRFEPVEQPEVSDHRALLLDIA